MFVRNNAWWAGAVALWSSACSAPAPPTAAPTPAPSPASSSTIATAVAPAAVGQAGPTGACADSGTTGTSAPTPEPSSGVGVATTTGAASAAAPSATAAATAPPPVGNPFANLRAATSAVEVYSLPFPALSRDDSVLAWTAVPSGDYHAMVQLYRTWTGQRQHTLAVHRDRYERESRHLFDVLVRHDLRPMTPLERTDVRELANGGGYVDEWRGPAVRVEYWIPEAAATDPVAWVRTGESARYTVTELGTGRVRRRGSIRPRRVDGRGGGLMDPATAKIPKLPDLKSAYQSEDGRIVVLVFGKCDCACDVTPFPVIVRW